MDHTEQEWTKLTDIDLSRFAGQAVTSTSELAANANVYHKVSAKAWLDCTFSALLAAFAWPTTRIVARQAVIHILRMV